MMLAARVPWAVHAATRASAAAGSTARSRPPEVCASARSICSDSGRVPKSTESDTNAWLRWVPPATIPAASRSRTPSITGTAAASTTAATPDPAQSSRRWPSRPKPVTSVAACTASPTSTAASRAPALSVVITSTARATSRVGRRVALERGGDHSEPDRLREHEHVADPGARVGEHVVGMHGADDGESVLRLGVVDRVAAADERTGRAQDLGAPVEHPREQVEGQALARPGDEVQREQWRAPHRVDVGQRVRRGDAAPVERVVDDRGEEVGGDHDGEVVAQPVHRGVVGGVEPDEQIGVGRGGTEAADEPEHGPEVGGGELARAARAVRELREPDRFFDGVHPAHAMGGVNRIIPGGRRPGRGSAGGCARSRPCGWR